MSDAAFTVRTVMAPIDFSDASMRALEYGAGVARRFKAALRLAHIIPLSIPTFYAYPVPSPELQKSREREVLDRLESAISDEDRAELRCRCVVRTGRVDEELLQTIDKTKADLVVMGSHGWRGFEKWFVGSVAANMLRRVRVPVLTVAHTDVPVVLPFKKILAATDLSTAALAGIEAAAVIAGAFDASLTALHVCEQGKHNCADIMRAIPAEAGGLAVEREIVEGTPYETIVRYAEEESFDLIALTLQGGGFVHEALLGSTADRVIRSTKLPVLSAPGRPSTRIQ